MNLGVDGGEVGEGSLAYYAVFGKKVFKLLEGTITSGI